MLEIYQYKEQHNRYADNEYEIKWYNYWKGSIEHLLRGNGFRHIGASNSRFPGDDDEYEGKLLVMVSAFDP